MIAVQAWNTLRGRETVALARELLGGNGVVSDFLVAKAFADMEAIYTCATLLPLHNVLSFLTSGGQPVQRCFSFRHHD